MGIKVERICDICEEYFLQSISNSDTEVAYPVKFICSMCIIGINRLVDLMEQENEGRGISCVASIIASLNRGNIEEAKCIYMNEGDKIRAYPKIQNWFYKYLGCRLHNNTACENKLCKDVKKCNDEKL